MYWLEVLPLASPHALEMYSESLGENQYCVYIILMDYLLIVSVQDPQPNNQSPYSPMDANFIGFLCVTILTK